MHRRGERIEMWIYQGRVSLREYEASEKTPGRGFQQRGLILLSWTKRETAGKGEKARSQARTQAVQRSLSGGQECKSWEFRP